MQAVETSAASECQPLLTLPDKALDHFPEGAASQIPAAVPMCGRGEATHKGSDEGQDVALYRKPTLGYLGHLRWSDDGGGRAQSAAPSVRGASPDSSVDGVGIIMAAELHARNSALRLQLDHQLSLHAPSSPRKILGQLASASSSTDGSTDSSCMGGPDAVWADTCQGQLEALRRQHHQMSLPAVPAHCQHGQHPGAGDLRPFGEPPFIVDMCNSSSSSSGGSGSGGGSSSLSCSSPAPLHPQANQPHGPLMGGRSLRLILGLSVLLMVDAMGAGMIPGTFVVHYFHQTFSLSQSLLGSLLSISSTVRQRDAGLAGPARRLLLVFSIWCGSGARGNTGLLWMGLPKKLELVKQSPESRSSRNFPSCLSHPMGLGRICLRGSSTHGTICADKSQCTSQWAPSYVAHAPRSGCLYGPAKCVDVCPNMRISQTAPAPFGSLQLALLCLPGVGEHSCMHVPDRGLVL